MRRTNRTRFADRRDAGRRLAERLGHLAGRSNLLVLGLPRGGVPVAHEVARRLGGSLDVLVVRKLGVPGHEELAMGAVALGGVRVTNDEVVRTLGLTGADFEAVAAREERRLGELAATYRGERPFPRVEGCTVVLVDDGLATGASMRAALTALAAQRPAHLVAAVPVGAPETCKSLRPLADEVVCALTPERFHAVGLWYEDFSQTGDDEVRALLADLSPSPDPGRREAP